MPSRRLRDYFSETASKRLRAVEADPGRSNQHEFNGISGLRKLLGDDRCSFDARFVFLDDEQEPIAEDVEVTWYDARENNPQRSAEYRLYFPSSSVSSSWQEGDLVLFLRTRSGDFYTVVARAGTSVEAQLIWLFDLPSDVFRLKLVEPDDKELKLIERSILELIGIEVSAVDQGLLYPIISRFGARFPTTFEFSAFAREMTGEVDPIRMPDDSLLAWMEMEELLFHTLENHLVSQRLEAGFDDVEAFISFSLSVQNRRKSRAGHAFENHVEQILIDNRISYSRGAVTEGKSKPDFIFPGIDSYHDLSFPTDRLRMLAVKTSLKDRWRQILAEAERISEKHLITLQPAISAQQTDEMRFNSVRLVVPEPVQNSYADEQQRWLMSFREFMTLVE